MTRWASLTSERFDLVSADLCRVGLGKQIKACASVLLDSPDPTDSTRRTHPGVQSKCTAQYPPPLHPHRPQRRVRRIRTTTTIVSQLRTTAPIRAHHPAYRAPARIAARHNAATVAGAVAMPPTAHSNNPFDVRHPLFDIAAGFEFSTDASTHSRDRILISSLARRRRSRISLTRINPPFISSRRWGLDLLYFFVPKWSAHCIRSVSDPSVHDNIIAITYLLLHYCNSPRLVVIHDHLEPTSAVRRMITLGLCTNTRCFTLQLYLSLYFEELWPVAGSPEPARRWSCPSHALPEMETPQRDRCYPRGFLFLQGNNIRRKLR